VRTDYHVFYFYMFARMGCTVCALGGLALLTTKLLQLILRNNSNIYLKLMSFRQQLSPYSN